MKINREEALKGVDASLDPRCGESFREKIGLGNEVIDDKLANDIILGYQILMQEKKMEEEDYRMRCDEEIKRQQDEYKKQSLEEEYLKQFKEELTQ